MPTVIKEAQSIRGICLYPVQQLSGGCWLATDSGGNKRYVVGYLDNGKPFCEKAISWECEECGGPCREGLLYCDDCAWLDDMND